MKKSLPIFISILLILFTTSCAFNVFSNTNTGSGSVSITLPGASNSRFILNEENPELPAEYTVKIKAETGSFKYEKTHPAAATVTVPDIPVGKYEVTVIGASLSYSYEDSTTVTVEADKESQAVLELNRFLKNIYISDKPKDPTETTRTFSTITEALTFMDNKYEDVKFFIDGSITDCIIFNPPTEKATPTDSIKKIVVEKAPGATKAEIISTEEVLESGTSGTMPIFSSNRPDVNIFLNDLTLTVTKAGLSSGGAIVFNQGTCSLTNVEFKVPETAASSQDYTTLITVNPTAKCKIGGRFNMPLKTRIFLPSMEGTSPENSTITIIKPLTTINNITIETTGELKSGKQIITGEAGINLADECGKFTLEQPDKNSIYNIDETGKVKKTHTAIYLQSDINGNCTWSIGTEGTESYELNSYSANTPVLLENANGPFMAEIGQPCTLTFTITPSDGATPLIQTHRITPVENKQNIIFAKSNNEYIVDLQNGGYEEATGSADKPAATIPRALELIKENERNSTLVSNSKPSYTITIKDPEASISQPMLTSSIVMDMPINLNIKTQDYLSLQLGTQKESLILFIIDNKDAVVTLSEKISFLDTQATNSGRVQIKQGKLVINLPNGSLPYDPYNPGKNGFYICSGSSLTIKGSACYPLEGLVNPIYLEKGAYITADFDKIDPAPDEGKDYRLKLRLADDFDKTQQIVKPASGRELTQDQINSFVFVTNGDEVTPNGNELDKTGHIILYDSASKAIKKISESNEALDLKVNIATAQDFTDLGTAIKSSTGGNISLDLKYDSSVTGIPDNSFKNCQKLTSIKLAEGITNIGNNVFDNSGITSLDIPNSVTSIADKLSTSNITTLTTPCTLSYIDNKKLENVTIKTTPTSTTLVNHAFSNCKGLTSVTLPDTLTSIGDSAFSACNNSGFSAIDLKNVTELQKSAFTDTALTSIDLKNVTKFGTNVFYHCTGLTSATNLKALSVSLFDQCTALSTVTFAQSADITVIPEKAFNGTIATIPESITDKITEVQAYGLKGAQYENTTLSFPVLTTLGDYALSGGNYTSITIPSSINALPVGVFSDSNLTSFDFTNITTIGDSAFSGCQQLTDITNLNGVTSIGKSAFRDCVTLTTSTSMANTLTVPGTVHALPAGAFFNCVGIKTVVFKANDITLIDESEGSFDNDGPTFGYDSESIKLTNIYGDTKNADLIKLQQDFPKSTLGSLP